MSQKSALTTDEQKLTWEFSDFCFAGAFHAEAPGVVQL
jgi:hypothetical protein